MQKVHPSRRSVASGIHPGERKMEPDLNLNYRRMNMRIAKRLLALGAAVAAMAVFAAPASAGPPSQASCQGILFSLDATSGALQGGGVAGAVHDFGHEQWADFQREAAQLHGC